RMALRKAHAFMPEANPDIRPVRRRIRVTDRYYGQQFFVRETFGRRMRLVATALVVVLLCAVSADMGVAHDSMPSILRIPDTPFIVYCANVFAILGLRAMYFLLAGVIHRFHYLKIGLSVVLVFVGVRMLLADVYSLPIGLSLGVIALVLGVAT